MIHKDEIIDYEKLAKELEKKGKIAILAQNYLYIIYDATIEDGYMIDKYDPFDIDEGIIDGGLYTGSAFDAVEFLL